MSWIESIRYENGAFYLVDYHERRILQTLESAGLVPEFQLGEVLKAVQKPIEDGRYKFRMVYNQRISDYSFSYYQFRPIRSLKLVRQDDMEYDTKMEDRSSIEGLLERRGECDDIVIVRKGMVTDASYANLVFRRGAEWFTPAQPLLHGVMRQFLLDREVVKEEVILADEIRSYEGCKLINAMMGMEMPEISAANIVI